MFPFIGTCSLLSLLFIFQHKPELNSLIQEIKRNNDFSINNIDNECSNYYSPQMKPNKSVRKELVVPPMTLSATIMPVQSFYERSRKPNKNFTQILFSCRLWILALTNMFTYFSSSMSLNIFKTLGMQHGFSLNMLTFTYSLSFCLLVVVGPLVGHLSDYLTYRMMNSFINIISIISNIAMLYSLKYKDEFIFVLFSVVHIVSCMNLSTILNTHVMKVYTLQFFVEVIGVLGIVSMFGSFLESGVPLISNWFFKDKDNKVGYSVGIAMNTVGLILSLIETDTVFKFQREEVVKEQEIEDLNDL